MSGKDVTRQNHTHDEVKNRLNSEFCYNSVSYLGICILNLSFTCYFNGCEHRLSLFLNKCCENYLDVGDRK